MAYMPLDKSKLYLETDKMTKIWDLSQPWGWDTPLWPFPGARSDLQFPRGQYLERFHKIPGTSIQFRFDYTATTPETLYDEDDDKILQDLKQIAPYTGLDGCRMRCGFHFDYKGMELTYHKTLPYSTIVETDPETGITYDILYDILIKQTGEIHSDWTGVMMDVDAYEKVVFEPYDLKWLERV